MGELAIKMNPDTEAIDSFQLLKKTHTEEIVIALCGQLGTDIEKIQMILIEELKNKFNYKSKVIKLSEFISQNSTFDLKNSKSKYDRIKLGMDGGNELREKFGNQILSEFAIRDIISDKLILNSEDDILEEKFVSHRVCYIINSIKHPDEIRLLREVYRDILYVIGIFSPIDMRVKYLEKEIKSEGSIYQLINRDTGEDLMHGQKVEDAFVSSDYFIRVSSNEKSKLKPKIERFLNLVFDVGINTPQINETAMYQATAAAANSSCLSRQVGACITDSKGDILSLGWNDVPKFGGNLYPDIELKKDERCYNTGECECANVRRKNLMKTNILNDIKKLEILIDGDHDIEILNILDRNGIKGLIEFARSIHAEMHAIILGSQKSGDKMIGGKLFCTTYPCHNCARHIIVSGISEVYYIEPYKKSLCIELHSDAISESENDNNKVKILMYEGVAPNKYMEFYKLVSDNRKLKLKHQDLSIIWPKNTMTLRALHQLEAAVTRNLGKRNII
jgi:deoxycytidylate deaminase